MKVLIIIITSFIIVEGFAFVTDYINVTSLKQQYFKCNVTEIKCGSGECISEDNFCDGKEDCIDGSDEISCKHNVCSEYLFRCAYGACINLELRCNGVQNCMDNSDEERCVKTPVKRSTAQLPSPSPSTAPTGNLCKLPKYPENGAWEMLSRSTLKPDEFVNMYTVLTFSCNTNFKLKPDERYSVCYNPWSIIPKCIKTCSSLPQSENFIATCTLDGNNTSCDNPYEGTKATEVRVDSDKVPLVTTATFRICRNGSWDDVFPNYKPGCTSRDEHTSVTGPDSQECTCANSKFGCCIDGVSEAQGKNFEGCIDIPINMQASCSEPKHRGGCSNHTIKWFFDIDSGGCSRFWYGGCDGNNNRFNTEEECKEVCIEPTGKKRCNLPKVIGPCESHYPSWHYDTSKNNCALFIYGGCLGNNNRFETAEECTKECVVDSRVGDDPIDEQTYTVPVRASVNMTCNIRNTGAFHNDWIRADNLSLAESAETRDGNLFIMNTQLSDAGEYWCLVKSIQTGKKLVRLRAHLKVLSLPIITINPARQVIKPGDNPVINCTASGEEPITLSWSGINKELPRSTIVQGGYLQFERILLTDAGKYKCTAVNPVGAAEAIVEVILQTPPTITVNPTRQVVTLEDNVVIKCTASGVGPITVSWTGINRELPRSASVRGRNLKFKKIQFTDAGRYRCTAVNSIGEVEAYAEVIVQAPPSITVNPTRQVVTPEDNAVIECAASGVEPITVSWTGINRELPASASIQGGYLKFQKIQFADAGRYKCTAVNSDGEVEAFAEVIVLEMCPPLPQRKHLIVSCSLSGNAISCDRPFEGTRATVRCADLYEDPSITTKPFRFCRGGSWDYALPNCEPVCGLKSVDAQQLIINGNNSTRGEFPWHVAIYQNYENICGGSIITPKLILTAAHCFESKSKEIYLVGAGKYYRQYNESKDDKAQFSKVQELIIHEDYNGGEPFEAFDLAVVVLVDPFQMSKYVLPVCLDVTDFDLSNLFHVVGTVVGWGWTQETGKPAENLKYLEVEYKSKKTCVLPRDFIQYYIPYAKDKLCAGVRNQGQSACRGDSGGSLVFPNDAGRYVLRGIVSVAPRKRGGCDSNQYTLFTSVQSHISHIEELKSKYRI